MSGNGSIRHILRLLMLRWNYEILGMAYNLLELLILISWKLSLILLQLLILSMIEFSNNLVLFTLIFINGFQQRIMKHVNREGNQSARMGSSYLDRGCFSFGFPSRSITTTTFSFGMKNEKMKRKSNFLFILT